jgi:hypothetical protein
MTVIEVDGGNVKPLVVDSIQIFAGKSLPSYSRTLLTRTVNKGQRYSFVVSQSFCTYPKRVIHTTFF